MQNNNALHVVRSFLTAVQQGDFNTVGSLLHPEVIWQQPGRNRFSGTQTSAAGVFQVVGGMFEATANTMKLTDIKEVAVNDNSVACLLHWSASQPSGKQLEVDNIDVYTVKEGKITEAVIYSADTEMEDGFWGN